MNRVRYSKSPKVLKFQNLILPIIIILVVAAAVVAVLFINKESKTQVGKKTYQYKMSEKGFYDETCEVIVQKQNITMAVSEEGSWELDETPLYAVDSKTAYLTQDMSWSEIDGTGEWFVESLSSVSVDKGIIILSYDDKDYHLDGGFLHDSGSTYVFLDDVELRVDGDIYELSPLSFYSGESGVIRIYDYETDTLSVINGSIYKAEVSCDKGYSLNIISGIMTGTKGKMRLLAAGPSVLPSIAER